MLHLLFAIVFFASILGFWESDFAKGPTFDKVAVFAAMAVGGTLFASFLALVVVLL